MTGRLGVRSFDWQSIPMAVWPLVGLALLAVAVEVVDRFSPLSALIGAAPFLFAAAISYVEPLDRRYLYGALLIAANQAIILGTSFVDGALAFYVPILVVVADGIGLAAPFLLIGGLVLLGIALGGVRTRSAGRVTAGAAVMLVGVALAAGDLLWIATHPLPEFTPVESVVLSWLMPPAFALARAFLFASALDARRTWLAAGSGSLFALTLADSALLLVELGPGTGFELLALLVGLAAVAGWGALIGGALRGEVPSQRPVLLRPFAAQPREV